ncbi:NAD(P)H-dependent oxidoreductase [Pigmentibacter sp. JX0631]|uniref:NAD(P)H-dependent oxidoreductase n=1 Tax=Pigmentibacter sp. JX0631 TaxID=2976982 RepID=UPI0024685E91|nr:NAD(P)H-dependent oxidoreductase [Pigmentibacter sp. JX0631]WGL59330.1 NAD(P)H-dependent oxidoreductase [Pigmentibacter sp. JX0631]
MTFTDFLKFRHACKQFDPSKNISLEDKKNILEYARLSPSSFGLEPWKFIAISNKELREKLKPACWNQNQITSSSFIVLCLSYMPHHFRGKTEFLKQRVGRKSSGEMLDNYLNMIISYLAMQNTQEWAKRQVYIPLANMMTGAASLGIDSCPMEGFEIEKVHPILKEIIDWNELDLVAIVAFGHRLNQQSPQTREASNSVIEFID